MMIMKEFQNFDVAESEKEDTKTKKEIIENKIKESRNLIEHHEVQIGKLKYIIAEAASEKQKQIKDYEMVVNERDILGSQLIKRNQELNVLYEKIKIARSNLTKGEVHFRQKVAEFEALQKDLIQLREEYAQSEKDIQNIQGFKNEINSLEKELLHEKTKNRALADELKYPMNVHRWKKLEATDPENYERIMKIQTLQRRVITKTQEVEEKDKLIKEKEKLFMELTNVLSRQPGPEVYEQIEIYKSSLKDKTFQFKKMLAELKDTQTKVTAYKYEIALMSGNAEKIKGDYFKKRDYEEKQKLQDLQDSINPKPQFNQQEYLQSLGINMIGTNNL
jgi:hypothetical protein